MFSHSNTYDPHHTERSVLLRFYFVSNFITRKHCYRVKKNNHLAKQRTTISPVKQRSSVLLLPIIKKKCHKFNFLLPFSFRRWRKPKILKSKFSSPFFTLNFTFPLRATEPKIATRPIRREHAGYFSGRHGSHTSSRRERTGRARVRAGILRVYTGTEGRPSVSSPECLFRTTRNMVG